MLRVDGVEVAYGRFKAVRGVSLDLEPGTLTALVGPNGSGKTTLLKTIDGILKPVRGSVYVDGKAVHKLSRREAAKRIGFAMRPESLELTVMDFVLSARKPYISFTYTKTDREKALEALKLVDAAHFAERKLSQLSAGQLQRVLLARALASEPKILLLDEPTSNLDPYYQIAMMELVKRLTKEKRLVTIAALHDLTLAYRYADYVAMLKDGEVCCLGGAEEVITPSNIKAVYGVDAAVLKEHRAVVLL